MNKLKEQSVLTKEKIERMYKVAYYLDKKFLRPVDIVDLGIDVYKLKECGEVRMSKNLSKLKPHGQEIWSRMSQAMKAMFFWSYLSDHLEDVKDVLKDLEPLVKNVNTERNAVLTIEKSMSMKLPPELQTKIKEGFGREWHS